MIMRKPLKSHRKRKGNIFISLLKDKNQYARDTRVNNNIASQHSNAHKERLEDSPICDKADR